MEDPGGPVFQMHKGCGCTSVLTSVRTGLDLALVLARERSGTPGSHQGFDLDGHGYVWVGLFCFEHGERRWMHTYSE